MKRRIRKIATTAALTLAAVASAPAAKADTVHIKDNVGGDNTYFQTPTGMRKITQNLNGSSHTWTTGVFDFLADWGDGNGYVDLLTFCLDPWESLHLPKIYTIAPIEDAAGLSAAEIVLLGKLWQNKYADVISPDLGETDAMRKYEAAAFQLILWELLADDGLTSGISWTTGNFKITSTNTETLQTLALANDWITSMPGWDNLTGYELIALQASGTQDLIAAVPVTQVPLPGSAVAGMALLGVVGASRSLRNRSRRS